MHMNETEDVQIKEIQAANEATMKKLLNFKSGLQKLMGKKLKKNTKAEQPTHDGSKSPTPNTNSAETQIEQNQIPFSPSGGQFGFSSTLFRQINDDTAILSNPSGPNNFQFNPKSAYNSTPYHSVSETEYNSVNSKQSNTIYESKIQTNQSQAFKNSKKLFSQLDHLIKKVNKNTKLPSKPILNYVNKLQNKANDPRIRQFQFIHPSQSEMKNQQESKLTQVKQIKESLKFRQKKQQKRLPIKEDLKNSNNYLKNYKNNSEINLKTPPLPQYRERQEMVKKLGYSENLFQKQNNQMKNSIQQSCLRQKGSKPPLKPSQDSVQIHRNKIKQTINEKKRIVQKEGIDEYIELELSDQEEKHSQRSQKQQEYIQSLEHQKLKLQQELAQIEEELYSLQCI